MDRQTAADLLDNLIGMVEDTQENDYDAALKMGIEALKADVQPVVRCKDCRYRYLDKKYGFRCDLDTGDPFDEGRSAENDDWFCADGVKMDGEQNDRT